MAAPTHTDRVAPTGIELYNGFVSKVTVGADSNITFWEKAVKLPSLDGGPPIVRSTMFNTVYHTKHPGVLIDVGPATAKVAYCLQSFTDIISVINDETIITVTVCDGSQQSWFGYLQKFEPAELVPGQHPEATVTFIPTMYDYSNNVESSFLNTEAAGT